MTDIIETEKARTLLVTDDSKSEIVELPFVSSITHEIVRSEIIELNVDVEILESTAQGLVGKDGDKTFIHNQGVANSNWTVNHELNKFPSVTIVDSGGSVVEGEVRMIDNNNLEVEFSASFSGKAYCN